VSQIAQRGRKKNSLQAFVVPPAQGKKEKIASA